MQYILIRYQDGTEAYQEVCRGVVQRVTDMDGNTITDTSGSEVVSATPPQPVWARPDTLDAVPTIIPSAISKLDYMERFTDAELAAIYTAAKTYVPLEVWLDKFKLASEIDLNDPRTLAGLQALEAAGLLSAGRAQEIVGA